MGVAAPLRLLPGGERVLGLVDERGERRLEERDVDALAHAGAQCRQNTDRPEESGNDVGYGNANFRRLAAGVVAESGYRHQPANGLRDEIEAGLGCIRAIGAIARDRQVNEPWVQDASALSSKPSRSRAPGRKFSTNTSERDTSRCSTSRPSAE